jgi:hypothetical protein
MYDSDNISDTLEINRAAKKSSLADLLQPCTVLSKKYFEKENFGKFSSSHIKVCIVKNRHASNSSGRFYLEENNSHNYRIP